MGQTLLYPVGIKPSLMQQRTGRPAQVMYRQRFKVNSLLIYPLNHTINHIIQRCIRQRLTDVIAPGDQVFTPHGANLKSGHHIQRLPEINHMLPAALHPFFRDHPLSTFKIDFFPCGFDKFRFPHQS